MNGTLRDSWDSRGADFQPVLTTCRIKKVGRPKFKESHSHGLEARVTRRILAPLMLVVVFVTSALGDVTPPVSDPPLPHTALGNEPIRSSPASLPPTNGAAANLPAPTSMDYPRVLGALGIVIALIFLLRWAARFFFPSVAGRSPSRIVEVLARSVLTPKQQVMLVRVGRRLILVGDSGAQMTTLCEIADPDEVASLVGQLRDEKMSAAPGFGSLFARFTRRFDPPEQQDVRPLEDAEDATPVASARSELDGLRDRVRQLAEQFK